MAILRRLIQASDRATEAKDRRPALRRFTGYTCGSATPNGGPHWGARGVGEHPIIHCIPRVCGDLINAVRHEPELGHHVPARTPSATPCPGLRVCLSSR